ncbi:MAG: 16S rRNA (uracil(1498)-N(3))-methyltransferase [Alphaproteobacteria bacterium]|nr:16S rRNA (uracil(1498)-N(3))-methyltransferase [Alphaproteobacteria bacterium]
MKNIRLLPRLFWKEALANEITITDAAQHYLVNVLRLKENDIFRIFNDTSGEYLAIIKKIEKKKMLAELLEKTRELPKEDSQNITLYCSPIKKTHFDNMIEKATELGISVIAPILTARTVVREVNTERLTALCIESSEQSERLTVPKVLPPVSLKEMMSDIRGTVIVCAETGNAMPIYEVISKQPDGLKEVSVITGPEGGFTPEEFELLRTIPNVLFVRLGERILRADTAAIAALACWQAVCGDWQ